MSDRPCVHCEAAQRNVGKLADLLSEQVGVVNSLVKRGDELADSLKEALARLEEYEKDD